MNNLRVDLQYVTVKEAATLLNRSREWVQKLIGQDRIPGKVKINDMFWLIPLNNKGGITIKPADSNKCLERYVGGKWELCAMRTYKFSRSAARLLKTGVNVKTGDGVFRRVRGKS